MNMVWSPNPRRKRRKMSAKQRKFFGGKKRGHTRSRRRRSQVVAASPVAQHVSRRRRRAARSIVRRARRGARRASRMGGIGVGSAIALLKAGAIRGAGAVAVDVAMAQVKGFLPASMQTPVDAGNNPNYGYYAAKFGIALALGTLGRRLPVIGAYAGDMAEGSATVLAYQFMRPMVPAQMLAAYFNPAPTMRPNMGGVGKVGAYVAPAIGVRAGSTVGRGSRAAGVVGMINTSRQAA